MLTQDKELLQKQNDQLAEAYREQATRYDRDEALGKLSDDYIGSYKRQIDNLNETLDVKESQTAEYLTKLSQLKDYSSQLKAELERLYSKEGKVLDKELQTAPVALNQDSEKLIRDELGKSRDKRAEINTNARIEQLEKENQMLKEQVEQGGLADTNEMLRMAEEKNKLLMGEIEMLQEQVN